MVIMALSTSVMSCSKEKETHLSNTICTTSDADCDEQTEQNYEWVCNEREKCKAVGNI